VRAGENLNYSEENLLYPKTATTITGNLLLRCQYAFRVAAGLALAGQVVEAFVMQRSVLEYAGYCLTIYETPALEEVFLSRHIGKEERSVQRKAFQFGPVRTSIDRNDAKLAEHFAELYKQSIDFGGHPNPCALVSAIDFNDPGWTNLPFSDEREPVEFALKSAAQVGLTALCILQHVFKEKFELLGIRQEIDALKASGSL
jgi:hypothetical protein